MKDLIQELPGIELSVGEVNKRLQTMWQGDADGSPSEFRASQMNVVLHFGWEVSPEEARARFNALIQFAQRYPSRIIVLCPSRSISDGSMSAKLFSQCYIGDSHREMCCCEALMLSYQPEDCGYLGNQVSVWLEPDLPTYHWFNRVPAARIPQYFDSLLVGVRRCIYDSSIESTDIDSIEWPEPSRVSDLAAARLLPVRQAIGQYLSGYAIEKLGHGLQSVRIRHCASMSGEGRRLLEWVKDCLGECEDCEPQKADYDLEECSSPECSLTLELHYNDDRYFRWRKINDGNNGIVEAYLGKTEETITTQVKPLGAEQEIAEALFF
ncbi:MAG: glucose-6-phosphate dehydrogenase assembly protein OpcA [Verrucomicrobiota bacterium]